VPAPPSENHAPLFRAEVLQARTAQHLGSIRIGRNPRFALVAWVSIGLAAAFISFATWGQVTRKARIPGVLIPTLGTLQVTSTAVGVVTERRAKEGENVQAGQVLFVLNTDRAGIAGDTAALVEQSLQQRRNTLESERTLRTLQATQRRQALADRIRSLETEQAQANNEAAAVERRLTLSQKTLSRYKQLADEGFVAEAQSQQRQEEHLDLEARLDAARRNASALLREQQNVKADLSAIKMQTQAEQGQLDIAMASLAQEQTENLSRRQSVVTASQAGALTAIHTNVGSAVQPGQVLATIVPSDANEPGQLEAHLLAPSRSAGFVQIGQKVWLRYSAYPYQKFGLQQGLVYGISETPVNAQDIISGQNYNLASSTQNSEAHFRIRVKLAAQSISANGYIKKLKPGMTLEADIVQDSRAVWEWVLEPLIAVNR
jgi:membrane fusion protein